MDGFTFLHGFTAMRVGWGGEGSAIGLIQLARPEKSNAFNAAMFAELPKAVAALEGQDTIRVVLLAAQGRNFCAGLDLGLLAQLFAESTKSTGAPSGAGPPAGPADSRSAGPCPARARYRFMAGIQHMQDAFTALERLRWPVIAAVQGACVGAGVDMVTACDLRYCSRDAYFVVKEVDVAITADLGTLQRLPSIVGHGMAADMALTARRVAAPEAESKGLVSGCFDSVEAMMGHALTVAASIARKSPLAVVGTKQVLLHSRDHPVADSLEYVKTWNAAFLLSQDMEELIASTRRGKPPTFSKL